MAWHLLLSFKKDQGNRLQEKGYHGSSSPKYASPRSSVNGGEGSDDMQASAKFSSIDRLALLLAAIAHDVDHPANTNQFEIDTLSDLALLHNDQSVLENHHLVTTFNIMLDTDVAFLSDVDLKQRSFLRKRIVSAVLSTDMVHHFDMCKKLDGVRSFSDLEDNEQNMEFMTNLFVHTADLSAQVLPTVLAAQWETRVSEEFHAEALMRIKRGAVTLLSHILLHYCYTCYTVVTLFCYTFVTLSLHCCYTVVTHLVTQACPWRLSCKTWTTETFEPRNSLVS
jgi:hypothetical protein